jgi:hypothetical protein
MESQIDENALLVFMDECGDHSVERIDPDFPILLRAFGKKPLTLTTALPR